MAVKGADLDPFAVVPPDECRSARGGVVSSEETAVWAIPHLDGVRHGPHALDPSPGSGPARGIPIPLLNLVYSDALILPRSLPKGAWGIPNTDLGFLHGMRGRVIVAQAW